jgi:streptomycin 6-kinase
MADGRQAVLKFGMPHMEGKDEAAGLRFWNGDGTVLLIEFDARFGALLLERCIPGTLLRALDESRQDMVIAGLLKRLWKAPAEPHQFRPLTAMLDCWREEALAKDNGAVDAGLVREGLALFSELPRTAESNALLATDLHAGNVLRSTREPWLAIDPKPFVGDPAYDATQHLLNCGTRLCAEPERTVKRFAELLGLDDERVRLWTFARAAVQTANDVDEPAWAAICEALRR